MMLRFNGSQYFFARSDFFASDSVRDEITIRFRTRHFYGLLLVTQNEENSDTLEIFIYNSKLMVRYYISDYSNVSCCRFIYVITALKNTMFLRAHAI